MSAPTSIATTQNSAVQALHQHKSHGSPASNAPSQLQVSFANLISSLNGSSAAQSAGSALQVNAAGGVSSTNSLDMASLIEAMQSGNAGSSAVQEPNQSAHHQHHGVRQAAGMTDAGSTSSAVSAYSAMAAPATASVGVSTRA